MRKIAAIGLVALLSGVTVTGNAAEPGRQGIKSRGFVRIQNFAPDARDLF